MPCGLETSTLRSHIPVFQLTSLNSDMVMLLRSVEADRMLEKGLDGEIEDEGAWWSGEVRDVVYDIRSGGGFVRCY